MSAPTALPILVRAYAKINLSLRIHARRSDGYHVIDSVMQTVSLHDTLEVEITQRAGAVQLGVEMEEGVWPKVPDDASNLCFQAAKKFLEATEIKQGAAIRLSKRIPMQAGLGGGSSDAAATLRALNKLAGEPLTHNDLTRLARDIGADVPFFLTGGTCRIGGIGEIVQKLDDIAPMTLLIAKPTAGVSTAEAYAQIDRLRGSGDAASSPSGSDELYVNDFEEVVPTTYPQVAQARELLRSLGCDRTLLCGSGSAVAGLIQSRSASDNQARLKQMHLAAQSRLDAGEFDGVVYPGRTIGGTESLSDAA